VSAESVELPRKPVHLDTDLGGDPDDSAALAWLLRCPDVDLVGITTNSEKRGARAELVRDVLNTIGRTEVPVRAGAAGSISGFQQRWPTGFNDAATYWPKEYARAQIGTPEDRSLDSSGLALDLLAESIERGATVIGIGPFTNLALVEVLRPGVLADANLVLMGGAIHPVPAGYPSWGAEGDYNVQQDIQASLIVLSRSDPLLVPLEVTAQFALTKRDAERLKVGDQLAQILAHQAIEYARANDHDELARQPPRPRRPTELPARRARLHGGRRLPGITVEEIPLRLKVVHGLLRMTVGKGGRLTRVVTTIDTDLLAKVWLETIVPGTAVREAR
jgi:inosine-uridine nucleoside N-ribohydrolase